MRKRIFANVFFLSAFGIIVSALLVSLIVYSSFLDEQKKNSAYEARNLAAALNAEGEQEESSILASYTDTRITLIAADGTVLYDSLRSAAEMENHLDREEVAAALLQGEGQSVRRSETLGMQTIYNAVRLENGNVVRAAQTTSKAWLFVWGNVPYIAAIIALMLLLSAITATAVTKKLTQPINGIDLDNPLENDIYGEFTPLLRKIDAQNKQIKKHISDINRKQSEFESIAQNMNEGLVLLNQHGKVLSVNRRSYEILSCSDLFEPGDHYFMFSRNLMLREAASTAIDGKSFEKKAKVDGRWYQFIANPVISDGKIIGAAVIILDINDKEETDTMRREFSANVSHELKTPLTAISGYAEIIENKIAKPDDVPDFAHKICRESARLLALIEDIIKLSRLDEGATVSEPEEIDILGICIETKEQLAKKIEEHSVDFEVKGERVVVRGVVSTLSEMLYNLCDNAIKYNKERGSVEVEVSNSGDFCKITVADTGIGIAPEHRQRIFERFYRVDKSHSRATGGTGLGLSIAMHAARFHKGTISVSGNSSGGTTFTVLIPKGNG
ncbi:MAG: PAS domain-containing sensor histidine kinase [Oscillospiraceae bacterium]|jgi:two-component system phosphate regulon sensor histidine kinase PhoR|nr:PAS domain-containing sensor histidine kinase [Oscillospiraceae bacterium]